MKRAEAKALLYDLAGAVGATANERPGDGSKGQTRRLAGCLLSVVHEGIENRFNT